MCNYNFGAWEGGSKNAGRAPKLQLCPSIRLTTEEKSRKIQRQSSRKVPANSGRAFFDVALAAVLHAASTFLLYLVPLACASGNVCRPSVSVNSCRVAELMGSPHQL
jgi:hypothetical protein